MKIMTNKVLNIIFPIILIIITGKLSNVGNFNFMNYKFMLSKNIFIIIYIVMLLLLSRKKYNIYNLTLDDIYYYKLHILLNIICIFMFFLYRCFFISFIAILFNLIVLVILLNRFIKLSSMSIFYILYLFF